MSKKRTPKRVSDVQSTVIGSTSGLMIVRKEAVASLREYYDTQGLQMKEVGVLCIGGPRDAAAAKEHKTLRMAMNEPELKRTFKPQTDWVRLGALTFILGVSADEAKFLLANLTASASMGAAGRRWYRLQAILDDLIETEHPSLVVAGDRESKLTIRALRFYRTIEGEKVRDELFYGYQWLTREGTLSKNVALDGGIWWSPDFTGALTEVDSMVKRGRKKLGLKRYEKSGLGLELSGNVPEFSGLGEKVGGNRDENNGDDATFASSPLAESITYAPQPAETPTQEPAQKYVPEEDSVWDLPLADRQRLSPQEMREMEDAEYENWEPVTAPPVGWVPKLFRQDVPEEGF